MLAAPAPVRSAQKGTNVRPAISLVAAAAPGLVASWAIRRFCTPPREQPAGFGGRSRQTTRRHRHLVMPVSHSRSIDSVMSS